MRIYKFILASLLFVISLFLFSCAKTTTENATVAPIIIPPGVPPIKIDTYYPTPVVTKVVIPPSTKAPRVANY